jgi:hypothetical protein
MAYKIGTQFKTRSGRVATFVGYWAVNGKLGNAKDDVPYPVVMRVSGKREMYRDNGRYDFEAEHELDLVEMLPAKKKAKRPSVA